MKAKKNELVINSMAARIPIIALLLVSLLTGCARERIEGNYDVVTRHQASAPFSEVFSGGNFRVFVFKSDSTRIEIKGESNVLPYVDIYSAGNRVHIGFRIGYNIREHYPVEVYLYTPDLMAVNLSGSGSIECEAFNCDKAEVKVSGSGSVECHFHAISLEARVSGSGGIEIEGEAENAELHISGSGGIDARELELEKCNVYISGSGSTYIDVDDFIEAWISGSGCVYYRGNPVIVSHISGSGKILRF